MALREDGPASLSGDGHPLTDPHSEGAEEASGELLDKRSLIDDIGSLVEDAKLYLDAELSYQKTRARFVGDRVKKTIVFALAAGFVSILATVGLTVGLLLALAPLITAWGATAIVVIGYLLLAYFLIRKAGAAWRGAMSAMRDEKDAGKDDG